MPHPADILSGNDMQELKGLAAISPWDVTANEETSGSNPTFNIAVHVEIPVTEVGEGIKVAKFQDPEVNRIALQERWPPAS